MPVESFGRTYPVARTHEPHHLPVRFATCPSSPWLCSSPAAGAAARAATPPPTGPLPTATLTAPADRFLGLTGTIAVTATASDDVAVTGVEFQIDGVTIGAVDTTAPYAATLDTSLYPSGQHVLRARASDAAGNVSAWSTALVQFGGGIPQPSGFTLDEAWITGLAGSTAFAQAPDGRIFVAQQHGAIRVIKDGVLLPTPFATMTVDSSGERGLLGIALHPDFASNGYVYVYSTRTDGGTHNRISRFTAAGDVAAAGSEIALVDLPNLSSETLHNGGAIHFGSDGKLYVGVGDNGDELLGAGPGESVRQAAALQRGRHDPDRQPVLRHAERPGARGLGLGPAQPVHLRGAARHRHDPHQRRRPGRLGRDQPRRGRRQLRLAVLRRPEQPRPRLQLHRAAVHLSAQRSRPARLRARAASSPAPRSPAAPSIRPSGPFPAGYRDQYYFADFVNKFVARLDAANGNAVYTFAQLSASPVDLLVGIDGALYVLTRGGITRISAP